MQQYSTKFKEKVIQKKLSGRSVLEISRETGVACVTIYNWIKNFKNGTFDSDSDYPGNFSIHEKYRLLSESFSISKKEKGQWLRKNGVHPDHLKKWDVEIQRTMSTPKNEKNEIRKLKAELKKARKEIDKKDKALAEAAALLVLKKKYQHLWAEEDE